MKPNVWKKISSVIIILIMMVRNVHTSSDTCSIEIYDRAFQQQGRNVWLAVNETTYKPQLVVMEKGSPKPRLCILKPKDQINYYVYDIATHFFICAAPRLPGPGAGRRDKSRRADKVKHPERPAVARRILHKGCVLTEQWSGNSYMTLYGNNNTTELRVARLWKKNKKMVLLMHNLAKIHAGGRMPRLRDDSCEFHLRAYCRTIGAARLSRKHVREFHKTFCAHFCWTFP